MSNMLNVAVQSQVVKVLGEHHHCVPSSVLYAEGREQVERSPGDHVLSRALVKCVGGECKDTRKHVRTWSRGKRRETEGEGEGHRRVVKRGGANRVSKQGGANGGGANEGGANGRRVQQPCQTPGSCSKVKRRGANGRVVKRGGGEGAGHGRNVEWVGGREKHAGCRRGRVQGRGKIRWGGWC